MISVTNVEFLTAIFGTEAAWCHVTDFSYDPGDIPKDRRLASWRGDYFSQYPMQNGTNQYFTISLFYCDDDQRARRRMVLFRQTPCIVLDDVKEKLSMEEVSKLPSPSWILETSKGSEQWGYILNTPCTNRSQVENLLDGLVANGLAPQGKDPGMKGVTRYVRLPEGYNTKASRLIDGKPYKCRMMSWSPFNVVTMEQLATPFMVDLHATRRESRVDGAAAVSDHPLVNVPDILHIKEIRSEGRFDITCPWVADHTGGSDDGAAVFTNEDGSIGFKCHHGSCQERTGKDLLQHIEGKQPGFLVNLKNWQIVREFSTISEGSTVAQPVVELPAVSFMGEPAPVDPLGDLLATLQRISPRSPRSRTVSASILKHCEDLNKLDQIQWHTDVCDIMGWGKGEFKDIIKDLRLQWYGERTHDADFYDDVVFIRELNQFYNWNSRIFFSAEAFQNGFADEDADARKAALQEGRVKKVDKLDYRPKKPRIFTDRGVAYANSWSDASEDYGTKGSILPWERHFGVLGWEAHKKHVTQFLAFTIRHPDIKINHMLMLGGIEGSGKDFLLYPLIKAMGDNATIIQGDELLSDFKDYLLTTKYLNINEADFSDKREAMQISNKIKPLATAPPDTLRVNQKGIKPIKIQNILSATMTMNSPVPFSIKGASRRFYAMWSTFNPRDSQQEMRPEWQTYWADHWKWMLEDGGWQHVAHHLMYEVDLSDFNPAAAPPMTDFLRDITSASKPPLLQTIEAFISAGVGNFASDVLTAKDISASIVNEAAFSPNIMYTDVRNITPIKVGMALKECGAYTQIETYAQGARVRLWVLRNEEKYFDVPASAVYQIYRTSLDGVPSPLKAVE